MAKILGGVKFQHFGPPLRPKKCPSPTGMISCDSCMQPDTRNSKSRRTIVSTLRIFKKFASSSCGLRPIYAGKIAEQREGCWQKKSRILQCRLLDLPGSFRLRILCIMHEEFILKIVWWGSQGIKCWNCISVNSLTSGFQCWKSKFKTEVCCCSGCPTVAMLWIKEVEVAKLVDDLVTSQLIEGRYFLDFEMLDAKIAFCIKRDHL